MMVMRSRGTPKTRPRSRTAASLLATIASAITNSPPPARAYAFLARVLCQVVAVAEQGHTAAEQRLQRADQPADAFIIGDADGT